MWWFIPKCVLTGLLFSKFKEYLQFFENLIYSVSWSYLASVQLSYSAWTLQNVSLPLFILASFKIAHWVQLELSLCSWVLPSTGAQANISRTPEEKWLLSIQQQLSTANDSSARGLKLPFIYFAIFTDLAFVQALTSSAASVLGPPLPWCSPGVRRLAEVSL